MLVVSCNDDGLPDGLYDYQVIRLLASDTSKIWSIQGLNQELCDSSYFYHIENLTDSLSVTAIGWNCDTNAYTDTLLIGYGDPTSIGLDFSDTLLFDEQNYWILEELTAQYASVTKYPSAQRIALIQKTD